MPERVDTLPDACCADSWASGSGGTFGRTALLGCMAAEHAVATGAGAAVDEGAAEAVAPDVFC